MALHMPLSVASPIRRSAFTPKRLAVLLAVITVLAPQRLVSPAQTAPPSRVTGALSAAGAALPVGTLKAWGWNGRGQLGTGNPSFSHTPLSVLHMTDAVAIAASDRYALALRRDGTVWAWGQDEEGQLGRVLTYCPYPPHISSEPCSAVPVHVEGLDHVTAIAASTWNAFALRADGTVWGWGNSSFLGQEYFIAGSDCGAWAGDIQCVAYPQHIPGLDHVIAIAAGSGYGDAALALKADGTVWAWGDGTGSNSLGVVEFHNGEGGTWAPLRVAGLRDITAVATNGDTNFALGRDGALWAWGGDDTGQRGDGRHVPQPEGISASYPPPSRVVIRARVLSVSTGDAGSMAVTADGALWSWGSRPTLAQPAHDTPVRVPMPVPVVVADASSSDPTMALGRDGSVWTWGDNYWGQLGIGRSGGAATTPQRVRGLGRAVAIAAGFGFGLAIQAAPATSMASTSIMGT